MLPLGLPMGSLPSPWGCPWEWLSLPGPGACGGTGLLCVPGPEQNVTMNTTRGELQPVLHLAAGGMSWVFLQFFFCVFPPTYLV